MVSESRPGLTDYVVEDLVQRIEIIRDKLSVVDLETEFFLNILSDLEESRRIYDTFICKGVVIAKRVVLAPEEEVLYDVVPYLLFNTHLILLESAKNSLILSCPEEFKATVL
mgnify:CR=1 FL=1